MNDDPLIQPCAALVEKGDPDRFLATMAAPPAARPALFTLYAANLEIARAPWVTKEPLIAQMRLQFWRDTVNDPAQPPAHEVAGPLAWLITRHSLPPTLFDSLITARERDIDPAPFPDSAALWTYLEDSAGSLMALALRTLGQSADNQAREWGAAQGLANYFLALPALQAMGRQPLPDHSAPAIAVLAAQGLDRLARARAARRQIARAARPALLAAWRAAPLLKQAASAPQGVTAGTLGQSEFARRASLIRATLLGP